MSEEQRLTVCMECGEAITDTQLEYMSGTRRKHYYREDCVHALQTSLRAERARVGEFSEVLIALNFYRAAVVRMKECDYGQDTVQEQNVAWESLRNAIEHYANVEQQPTPPTAGQGEGEGEGND